MYYSVGFRDIPAVWLSSTYYTRVRSSRIHNIIGSRAGGESEVSNPLLTRMFSSFSSSSCCDIYCIVVGCCRLSVLLQETMTRTTKRRWETVAGALQKYFLSAFGYHTDTTRHVTTSDKHYNTPLPSNPHTHYVCSHTHTRKPLIFWVLIMNDAAEMCVIPVIIVCDTYVVPMYDTAMIIIIIITYYYYYIQAEN